MGFREYSSQLRGSFNSGSSASFRGVDGSFAGTSFPWPGPNVPFRSVLLSLLRDQDALRFFVKATWAGNRRRLKRLVSPSGLKLGVVPLPLRRHRLMKESTIGSLCIGRKDGDAQYRLTRMLLPNIVQKPCRFPQV